MTRIRVAVLSLLLVTSLFAMAVPGTAVAESQANDTYAGAHVDFAVEGDAIANYSVAGEETFTEVRVQSASETDAGLGVGLGAVVNIDGAGLSLSAQSQTRATVTAESGAELSAHDTERGHLVVSAGGEEQVVEAQLAADAAAESEGDAVVVSGGDREGAFVVVGEGEVTVNDEGDVAAELAGDAQLVFRSYADGERDERAKTEEALIADGAATVDLSVERRGGEVVSEAVTYGQETSAEASASAQNRVEVTIDRTVSEGTIVLTTVSEEAVGSIEDLEVAVDGEAAAEASSQSELEAGAAGEEPRYMVTSHNEAEGEATVAVAIDHFSERTLTMTSDESNGGDESTDGDGSDGDDGSGAGDGMDTDSLPGFGAFSALLAALLAVGARVR